MTAKESFGSGKVEFIGKRAGQMSETSHLHIPAELQEVALYLNQKIASARSRVQQPTFDPKENHPNPHVKAVAQEVHTGNLTSLGNFEKLLFFLGDKNYGPVLEHFVELLAECELSIEFRKNDENFFMDIGSATADELEQERSRLTAICNTLRTYIKNNAGQS
jgi:hypothetical protein